MLLFYEKPYIFEHHASQVPVLIAKSNNLLIKLMCVLIWLQLYMLYECMYSFSTSSQIIMLAKFNFL